MDQVDKSLWINKLWDPLEKIDDGPYLVGFFFLGFILNNVNTKTYKIIEFVLESVVYYGRGENYGSEFREFDFL